MLKKKGKEKANLKSSTEILGTLYLFLAHTLLSILAVFKRETHVLRLGHWFLVLEGNEQTQGKIHAQKTSEKTLSFHLALIPGSIQGWLSVEGQPWHQDNVPRQRSASLFCFFFLFFQLLTFKEICQNTNRTQTKIKTW